MTSNEDPIGPETVSRVVTVLLGAANTVTEFNAIVRVGVRIGALWRCPACKEPRYADREACCGKPRPASVE
ncbi:hypothetical protein ACIA7S_28690 [Streptomyces sp. NPDC051643]|uniref:hypothetical protein n=1 Tax=Streptomyces sp. NPDC051643 TaxID=3365665 RepID=UPI00379C3B0D